MRTVTLICAVILALVSCLSFGLAVEQTRETTLDNVKTTTTFRSQDNGDEIILRTLTETMNDEGAVLKSVEVINGPDGSNTEKTIDYDEFDAPSNTVTKVIQLDGSMTVTTEVPNLPTVIEKFDADGAPVVEQDGINWKKTARTMFACLNGAFALTIVCAYLWNLADPKASYNALSGGLTGILFWFLQSGESSNPVTEENEEDAEETEGDSEPEPEKEKESKIVDPEDKAEALNKPVKDSPATTPNTLGGGKKATKASQSGVSTEPEVHPSTAVAASTAAIFGILILLA